MKIFYTIVVIAVIASVGAAIGFNLNQPPEPEQFQPLGGGVASYNATTTSGATNVDQLLKTGSGIFGGVIITTAGNQVFDIYNATTTDVNQRTGNLATSTILLAAFPASAAVGEYHFDAGYNYGLLLDITAGTLGTTTILWE